MKKTKLIAAIAAGIGLAAFSVNAATMTVSASAPTVNGADIAQLVATDADWGSTSMWGDRPARGQTFTTGSDVGGYTLNSITYQSGSDRTDNRTYSIRVGTISGTDITDVASESTGVTGEDLLTNQWATWSFDTPVSLAANTVYGIDVVISSGSGHTNFRNTGNPYADGTAYNSGGGGVTGATISTGNYDYVFHLDMVAVPEPSTTALLGLGGLALILRRRK
jgi:hypothetical protein